MKKEYIVELREEEADELMEEHWVGEIVRCKDCKFLSSPPGSVMFCEHIHKFVDADWFCADGEHKDGERDG